MTVTNARRALLLLLAGTAVATAGCDQLQTAPYNGQTTETALGSVEGLRAATTGNYARLLGDNVKFVHQFTEYPSDNVALSGSTTDPLFFSYNYAQTPDLSNARALWRWGYQSIYGTNQVIEHLEPGASAEMDQMLGENLFLRSLYHFWLVGVFGRPYSQGRDNPGVPLALSTATLTAQPARAPVGEVYDTLVADLTRAAALMTVTRPNTFASRDAANALLARLYLYRGENDKAVEYATRVIDAPGRRLADVQTYTAWPTQPPEGNPEILFAVRFTTVDDRSWASIGSMYYRAPSGVGYGEMYASTTFYDLIMQNPADARIKFLAPQFQTNADGSVRNDAQGRPLFQTRNGVPRIYVTKYSGQEGIATLSSPVVLRLAEMHLTRAEANAKLGNAQAALDDVNRIRQRAGLSGAALYSTADLRGRASVLDVVLEERRLELAFEGLRASDLYRNGRTLVRDYVGFHLTPTNPGVDATAGTQSIPASSPRIVAYIPEAERVLNPNLTQNP